MSPPPSGTVLIKKTDEWPKWIRRFEGFRLASAFGEKGESHASKCIDLCNGEEADDIMTSFQLTDEEEKGLRCGKNQV